MPWLPRLITLLALCLWLAPAGAHPAAVVLDGRGGAIDLWPAVTMQADPSLSLTAEAVLRQPSAFARPDGPPGNLGARRDAVWLQVPLQAAQAGPWVLEIDYPALNRVDVYRVRGNGRLDAPLRLGSDQPFGQRPMATRAHAATLALDAGAQTLLLRVQSASALVLPLKLYRPDDFWRHETTRQLMHGLLLGLTLALATYSLVNLLSLRDPVFGLYTGMVLAMTVFFAAHAGIAQQHLWPELPGRLAMISPLAVLLALAHASLLVSAALDLRRHSPRVDKGLKLISAASVACLLAALAGLLGYREVQAAATALGPLPLALAVRAAAQQARRGSRSARIMLMGWAMYLVGALTMAGLLRGVLPADFWTQHLFQFAMMLEMLIWMQVLSLRVREIQRDAERVSIEHLAMRSLAHTDPLTGLPNRRGLGEALAAALQRRGDDGSVLAVYLLDLDGFKPVNDRLGHDAGDALLVQVGQRLRGLVRGSDLVARLGGDEFVVVSGGLASEADAVQLGRKLLDAFSAPFEAGGQTCKVGLTIGYALAPQDGQSAGDLLKSADTAMYAGKHAGRHCVRRAVPAAATAN